MSEEVTAKRKTKDTVFTDLFRIPRYQTELVNTLCPDIDAKPEDIKLMTLNYVMLNEPYNDFGAIVKDKLLFCSEAQSTWSLNILFRIFLYAANTYQKYIDGLKDFDIYSVKKQKLPILDCSVIYCGKEKNLPQYINLNQDFFDGKSPLDLKVKVLNKAGKENIVEEYISFCHIFDEQVKLHGYTKKAVEETIKICSNKNILGDYMREKEKEVHDIMYSLFDQEEIQKRHWRAEGIDQGKSEMIKNMLSVGLPMEQVIQVSGWSEEQIRALQ